MIEDKSPSAIGSAKRYNCSLLMVHIVISYNLFKIECEYSSHGLEREVELIFLLSPSICKFLFGISKSSLSCISSLMICKLYELVFHLYLNCLFQHPYYSKEMKRSPDVLNVSIWELDEEEWSKNYSLI
jgi:membrane-associated HD superfamily phosphohydrolase